MRMSENPPRLQPLVEPEFHSSIPPHLISKLSEREQHQIHALSTMESRLDWFMGILRLHHAVLNDTASRVDEHTSGLTRAEQQAGDAVRQLVDVVPKVGQLVEYRNTQQTLGVNEKVTGLWDWKTNFTGRIAVVYVIGAALASMFLNFVGEALLRYFSNKP